MIDFTTLQTNPIPAEIIKIQKVNTNLRSENKMLKDILIFIAIGGAVLIGYQIYKQIKENEKRLL